MIIVNQIKFKKEVDTNLVFNKAIEALCLKQEDVSKIKIQKRAIDARKRTNLLIVYSVAVWLKKPEVEQKLVQELADGNIIYKKDDNFSLDFLTKSLDKKPVIVGFGPAGMFCALILALKGQNPIVIERGKEVDKRTKDVLKFWQGEGFSPDSNALFGEGGAGTFSDGKLNTRINDEKCRYILEQFVKFGAPPSILEDNKPHVGTDVLKNVVKNIRNEIIRLGGQIIFDAKMTDIKIKNSAVHSVITTKGEFECDNLVLAIGHSARDSFELLHKKGVNMESKAFSVGVRIEHLRTSVNKALYGKDHEKYPAAMYNLWSKDKANGKCVYTFCNCPGGVVVACSSEEGQVVTNGMSYLARNEDNTNSALVVSVDKADFGQGIFDGVNYQRQLETLAFKLGNGSYHAPCQTVKGFMENKKNISFNRVIPSYKPGIYPADFNEIFHKNISDMLKRGITEFGAKTRFFADNDAVLTGVETRTSSPIRILRQENGQALAVSGLFPCGEGAGYAGGIVSAAIDGINTAIKMNS